MVVTPQQPFQPTTHISNTSSMKEYRGRISSEKGDWTIAKKEQAQKTVEPFECQQACCIQMLQGLRCQDWFGLTFDANFKEGDPRLNINKSGPLTLYTATTKIWIVHSRQTDTEMVQVVCVALTMSSGNVL
jgi:hypothetical protein